MIKKIQTALLYFVLPVSLILFTAVFFFGYGKIPWGIIYWGNFAVSFLICMCVVMNVLNPLKNDDVKHFGKKFKIIWTAVMIVFGIAYGLLYVFVRYY